MKTEGLQGSRERLSRVAKTGNRDVEGFSRDSGEDTMRVLSGNKGVEGSGSGELELLWCVLGYRYSWMGSLHYYRVLWLSQRFLMRVWRASFHHSSAKFAW